MWASSWPCEPPRGHSLTAQQGALFHVKQGAAQLIGQGRLPDAAPPLRIDSTRHGRRLVVRLPSEHERAEVKVVHGPIRPPYGLQELPMKVALQPGPGAVTIGPESRAPTCARQGLQRGESVRSQP